MKKFAYLFIFSLLLLILGRNLTFIPAFNFAESGEQTSTKRAVEKTISKQKGNYSVYYRSLTDNKFLGINEKQVHTAASVNKVPILAALYYLEKKGEINLDEQITLQEEDIQNYGTGVLRYEKPGQTYTLKTIAKFAGKNSDNTAAYIITTKIGKDKIQKIIEGLGLTQTSIQNNKTSAVDMYILFKKIYDGQITSPSLKDELLGFLKDTDTEDRIPYLLPENIAVYHKTGDETGILHDVGIIEYGSKTYFVGILASDIGDAEKETKGVLAKISKDIFNSQN